MAIAGARLIVKDPSVYEASLSAETVEKPFSIVNAWFWGVLRPLVIVRSLIVAHSVRSFFSASPQESAWGLFRQSRYLFAISNNSQKLLYVQFGYIISTS